VLPPCITLFTGTHGMFTPLLYPLSDCERKGLDVSEDFAYIRWSPVYSLSAVLFIAFDRSYIIVKRTTMKDHDSQLQASTNYKEAFALFDKRGTGRVALQSLGDLLRACGQNPTLAEIRELEKSVGGDCE
jgi:hypothetical protein